MDILILLFGFALGLIFLVKGADEMVNSAVQIALKFKIPNSIIYRKKMGFPVPLKEWFAKDLNSFVKDVFSDMTNKSRPYFNPNEILKNFGNEARFSRKIWGLLSLELWHNQFHDNQSKFKKGNFRELSVV